MNPMKRDTVVDGEAGAETPSTSDYRIRETEARLDRRIASIESQRSRMTWMARLMGAGFVLTLATLGLVLWIVTSDDGIVTLDTLSTEEIMLRDADGMARGRLGTDSDGRAQLSLSDRDGRERIRLTVLADGSPGVTISDPDARPRAVLGYLPDGTTNLVFADAQGVSRAVFGLDPDGSTQALFADRVGTIRTVVGVGAGGEPSISVFEPGDGEERSPAP
ncbi:MAG: hypothetical protein ACLFWG_03060 [Longimicrobiales bacterium]